MFDIFCFCLWRLVAVFADSDALTPVSVTEGDSVTLNSGLTEIQNDDLITWTFGHSETLIAQILKKAQLFSTSHGEAAGFRDRLKLDHQTGSLTITNIRAEHAGVYELLIVGGKLSSKYFIVSVNGVSADEEKSVSVMKRDSVTTQTAVTEMHEDSTLWTFGAETSQIAEINRSAGIFSRYNGTDERFRDRLKLKNLTGSLTITNTRTEDAGTFCPSNIHIYIYIFNISYY
ncbi:uncharacterized protein LOC109072657 isoform X2 [Cyprinus carpio]|uniref:Uncharacterized protein LOC109072657 isoform X2 n=1 Tax=Cyprinus carpio TaxID=7962 RepID=A0A9Q9V6K7_CYPCA|nr:uncharacterized protein LOC109072657 isoform X2 [Cyprinus carpio]